jgi:hypothetical protein
MTQAKSNQDNFVKARNGIIKFISNIFKGIKIIYDVLVVLIKKSMDLIQHVFSGFLEIVSTPSLPSILGIIAFVGVAIITGVQWWAIGQWLLPLLGLSSQVAGLVGLLFGITINAFQMAPNLWKLSRRYAKAYKNLKIDPDTDLPAMTLENRLDNWLSYDHQVLKRARQLAYLIEAVLVFGSIPFTGGTPLTFIRALISFFAPEQLLKAISATTELTNQVTEDMQKQEDNELDKYRKSLMR